MEFSMSQDRKAAKLYINSCEAITLKITLLPLACHIIISLFFYLSIPFSKFFKNIFRNLIDSVFSS